MMKDILDAALLHSHRQAGLYLVEEGDNELLLKRGDAVLAAFNATRATVSAIRGEANKYLSERR